MIYRARAQVHAVSDRELLRIADGESVHAHTGHETNGSRNTGAVAGLVALDLFNNTKVNDFSRKIELCCGDGKDKRKVMAALKKKSSMNGSRLGKPF